ncbi:hypothetical protein [Streptomyces sp. NPDC001594]|uniref:hypothetical protein n=1 Tax=Streptomyces sp. NPDC001594 TaxID=3364590 RepID=UPI0036B139DA
MNDDLSGPLAPLPVNVRPRLGETTIHYVQRLAHANHLKPSYLLWILIRPSPTRTLKPRLDRLAALSGRSADILKITLVDAAPPSFPAQPTASTLRLERVASEMAHRRSFNIIGQIKQHARRNKGTLRQIADMWTMPHWLIRKVLSPGFPNRTPVGKQLLSEDQHAKLTACYEQGMTAAQAWHDLIDNQDTWITQSCVQAHFALFDRARGKARLAPEE